MTRMPRFQKSSRFARCFELRDRTQRFLWRARLSPASSYLRSSHRNQFVDECKTGPWLSRRMSVTTHRRRPCLSRPRAISTASSVELTSHDQILTRAWKSWIHAFLLVRRFQGRAAPCELARIHENFDTQITTVLSSDSSCGFSMASILDLMAAMVLSRFARSSADLRDVFSSSASDLYILDERKLLWACSHDF